MPRKAAPPAVRSDGVATNGSLQDPGAGQPNGRAPRGAVTQAAAGAGAGAPMPYGEKTQLQNDAAQTPLPPGVTPDAHAAQQAMMNYKHGVTPLFAPTQRPMEPVTAGAPMDSGPTNPMALPQGQSDLNLAQILQEAADATGNPALQALAARASAAANQGAAAMAP